MTDNEIIKALECCINRTGNCKQKHCPARKECGKNLMFVEEQALSLINRQKSEIERLKEEIELLHSDYTYKFVKARAKAEAVKEFAERLKFNVTGIPWCEYGPVHREIDNLVKEMTMN